MFVISHIAWNNLQVVIVILDRDKNACRDYFVIRNSETTIIHVKKRRETIIYVENVKYWLHSELYLFFLMLILVSVSQTLYC